MRRFVYLLVPVVFALMAYAHLREVRDTTVKQYLAQTTALSELALTYSRGRFDTAMSVFLNEAANNDNIKYLLDSGIKAEGNKRDLLRAQLHADLTASYERLQSEGFTDLQFHTPDGYSYLRFHAPDRHDDFLLPYRPSLRLLADSRQPMDVFEVGRLFIGFRHIQPLFINERLIGSVEMAVSFQRVREQLTEIEPGNSYQFLLRANPVESVTLNRYRERQPLLQSQLLPNYLVIDETAKGSTTGTPIPRDRLAPLFAEAEGLTEGLASEKAFSLSLSLDGRVYKAAFVPVFDVDQQVAAYLVSYGDAPLLARVEKDYRHDLTVGLLVISVISILLAVLSFQHNRLRRNNRSMDAISAAVGEGIFVLGHRGESVYVNRSACQLTGYSPEELLNSDIHSLIHRHGPDDKGAPCPILKTLQTGVPYEGDEWFMHRDGSGFPVVVTSRPMIEDGHIAGVVTVFRDITERKKMEERLARLATVDELTGLLNRRALMAAISAEIARLHRSGANSAVMMIDFDHFKQINDTYGHDAGDRVLQHVSELARQCLRETDVLGRIGGEELAVLLPDTDIEGARILAERLREQVENSTTRSEAGDEISMTLSVGICELKQNERDASDLLRRADGALYKAKHSGRNRVECA
ncbi:sensor domain-containing diguanylate cyclase [Marinobacterium lutimaris]|nr:diguanylate cyclase [Marinobacterium lutimaris]